MAHTYDDQNIFAKILRGEIPNKTVLETAHSLAFEDIRPQAPVHVLVIPRGPYVSFDHFAQQASDAEIVDYVRAVGEVCRMQGLEADGWRLIANAGRERGAGRAASACPHPRRASAGPDAAIGVEKSSGCAAPCVSAASCVRRLGGEGPAPRAPRSLSAR